MAPKKEHFRRAVTSEKVARLEEITNCNPRARGASFRARMATDTSSARQRLAERVRASTQLDDPRIVAAFERVPRHEFVPEAQLPFAYEDRALPLDEGQTISQ